MNFTRRMLNLYRRAGQPDHGNRPTGTHRLSFNDGLAVANELSSRTFGLDMFLKFALHFGLGMFLNHAFYWIEYVPTSCFSFWIGNVPKICFAYRMDMFFILLKNLD